MEFYNTINLKFGEFHEEIRKAQKQEEKILAVFKCARAKLITPPEVYTALGERYPITSIRRAITNLTNAGLLEKTDKKKEGLYGKVNYCWRLLK